MQLTERVQSLETRFLRLESLVEALQFQLQELVVAARPSEPAAEPAPAAPLAAVAAAKAAPRRREGARPVRGAPRYYVVVRAPGDARVQLGIHYTTWARLTAGGHVNCYGFADRAAAEACWLEDGWEAPAPYYEDVQ